MSNIQTTGTKATELTPAQKYLQTSFKFNREFYFWGHSFSKGKQLMHGTIQKCDECGGPMYINAVNVMSGAPKLAVAQANAINEIFFIQTVPETGGYNEDTDTCACEVCS